MNLTEHFTLEEAVATSHRNITNELTMEAAANVNYVAEKLEMIREILGNFPIRINSWYRSPELNKAVGGSKKSQHMNGEAVDFICPEAGNPYQICQTLAANKLKLGIDQLIFEGSWVHVSFVRSPRVPRLEVLTYMLDKTYKPGLILKRR